MFARPGSRCRPGRESDSVGSGTWPASVGSCLVHTRRTSPASRQRRPARPWEETRGRSAIRMFQRYGWPIVLVRSRLRVALIRSAIAPGIGDSGALAAAFYEPFRCSPGSTKRRVGRIRIARSPPQVVVEDRPEEIVEPGVEAVISLQGRDDACRWQVGKRRVPYETSKRLSTSSSRSPDETHEDGCLDSDL